MIFFYIYTYLFLFGLFSFFMCFQIISDYIAMISGFSIFPSGLDVAPHWNLVVTAIFQSGV